MNIIHICSELAPIAKVGGLADVVYGLAKETAKNNYNVEIILPKYDCIDFSVLKNLKVFHKDLAIVDGVYTFHNTVWSAEFSHFRLFLIEPHHPGFYFTRGKIYGCSDDIERFTYFCHAALEFLYQTKKSADVLHLHDWPTALVAVLHKEIYEPLGYGCKSIVYTIHNLQYQGKCSPKILTRLGMIGEEFLKPEKLQDPISPGMINLMKGGIEYADTITTVSPTYEREIKMEVGGFHLNKTLLRNQGKLVGILNGIDETVWNPVRDPHLITRYPSSKNGKFSSVLKAKEENRKILRSHFGLKHKNAPLVVSVTRLVPQKSPELIRHGIEQTIKKGGQYILLGSQPSPELEAEFKKLQSDNCGIFLQHDESLAHLIFAGGDIFFIPSLFEPCGLTQMIALRYGTIPVARKTGGLADTVFDIDTSEVPMEERNGFTFDHPDSQGVSWALDRALEIWNNHPEKWHLLMQQAMKKNFTWKQTAPLYFQIYKNLQPPLRSALLM